MANNNSPLVKFNNYATISTGIDRIRKMLIKI